MINDKRVKYFKLNDYVNKIELSDNVLQHVEMTSKSFDKYINLLSKLNPNQRYYFLVESFKDEIKRSNCIENHIINPQDIKDNEVFFDSLDITNERIKKLHKFAMRLDKGIDYRNGIAYVSSINPHTLEETIYWYGVEAEDIQRFMNDFINIYKDTSISLISSNPFLKSALVSLLFIRIHPFKDGNGRTARLLHEMKFTELINKIYGSNLKICPLHISASILLNQFYYVNTIDDIYFDLEHDCNDKINNWFEFCLNMADEQIFYIINELNRIIQCYGTNVSDQDELFQEKINRIQDLGINDDNDIKLYKFKREEN